MDESELQQKIQIKGVEYGCQLLRNTCGAYKTSAGRWIWYGLGQTSKARSAAIKSSDLIGFTKILITPEMVGKTVAVFTAIEVKKSGWEFNPGDKREEAQLAFVDWIRNSCGIASFASSTDSLTAAIDNFIWVLQRDV